MKDKQFIIAACLVFLIALAGTRFAFTRTDIDHNTEVFAHDEGMTPAQQLLLGKTIDINTADEQAFEVLPLIGPKLAKRIVKDRIVNGPFASVHELTRVYGVGPRIVERNLPYIAVK
jgi:competence ComEA-like helix-hairpin-helix protein